jgi:anaerobic ribonucleoside-triphosphate reductase activating protein
MQYAGIIYDDFSAAPGVCLSFFVQGCPFRCEGCHNPETWDFSGGREFTQGTLDSIVKGLRANGVHRNLCIMGGEPLCPENSFLTRLVVTTVKKELPDTKIYIWTGNTYENLAIFSDLNMREIFNNADFLIDGPYIQAERDLTLPMRGSRNQRIIDLHEVCHEEA